jgi:hypothetical protein
MIVVDREDKLVAKVSGADCLARKFKVEVAAGVDLAAVHALGSALLDEATWLQLLLLFPHDMGRVAST